MKRSVHKTQLYTNHMSHLKNIQKATSIGREYIKYVN